MNSIIIENPDNASKVEIVKVGENAYSVTHYEYFPSCSQWRKIGKSETYTKDCIEWMFDITVDDPPVPAETEDDFSDINPAEVRAALESGEASAFVAQVIADVQRIAAAEHPTNETQEGEPTMNDSQNESPIITGDICEITGAYFKNDNGLWLVTASEGDPTTIGSGLTLHKLGKSGKLLESGSTVAFWPLKSFCSDRRKNAAARDHNREHAQIRCVNSVPTYYAAQYFRECAESAAERAENQEERGFADAPKTREIAEFYTAVAERLSVTAQPPKEKAPETGVKFYWNGIKVNGGKLVRCYYWLKDDAEKSVMISAKDYGAQLPGEYFAVENDTDLYTDYHDTDSATLTPTHPLYKFARYAALKGIMSGKTYHRPRAEQIKEWNLTKDPGQPTADDLAAVEALNTARESARLAAEHAAQLEAQEKLLAEQHAGRVYIEQVTAAHPIEDGAPTVEITFSENPAFYSWTNSHDQLRTEVVKNAAGETVSEKTVIETPRRRLILSVAAADIILKHYDDAHPENTGYDKTDFVITYTDQNSGEVRTHEGRYDLGDHEGGLIAHLRHYGEYVRTHGEMMRGLDGQPDAAGILALADYLEEHTAAGSVVSVTVPAWLEQAVERYKRRREAEQAGSAC